MARAQKLKVFSTPIGFHDAYVAAPSQKAALAAWGADTNLFAIGSAEQVKDAALTAEPLANPGKVIKRLRGTVDQHLAALPSRSRKVETKSAGAALSGNPRKIAPRPKRDALDRAEARFAALEAEHAEAVAELDRRQAALDRERRKMEKAQDAERRAMRKRVTAAREKYDAAMNVWRAD